MSIASALFTDSQARVFLWLFGQPSRSFYLSELRRLTGLGSASLQRELNRLADAGLVSSLREGNLRRFQANPDSPVYPELISLTRKSFGPAPLLRQRCCRWRLSCAMPGYLARSPSKTIRRKATSM
jgi:DNA-binding transcriptional ArsR family regulator